MRQALIIEDDHDIVDLLSIHLSDMHCQVSHAYDGHNGLKLARENDYDLILLDLMLPYMDGLDICRSLRAEGNRVPIIMLTAKSEEIDKVLGLESGADDYLTKPFSIRELQARIKAVFRRTERTAPAPEKVDLRPIRLGELEVDPGKRKVSVHSKRVELTPKELARHPGRSYSRTELLQLVWGYEFSGYEHTVNAHINRLRAKIEPDMRHPRYILTTWGVGYRCNDAI